MTWSLRISIIVILKTNFRDTCKVLSCGCGYVAFTMITDNCEKIWSMRAQLRPWYGCRDYQNHNFVALIAVADLIVETMNPYQGLFCRAFDLLWDQIGFFFSKGVKLGMQNLHFLLTKFVDTDFLKHSLWRNAIGQFIWIWILLFFNLEIIIKLAILCFAVCTHYVGLHL